MKRTLLFGVLAIAFCLRGEEKESFKKKRTPSLRTLTEQYGQELAASLHEMPVLQKKLAKQQKEIARLSNETIEALSNLLENEEKLDKKIVEQRLAEAKKLHDVLQQQVATHDECIAELREQGKQKKKSEPKPAQPPVAQIPCVKEK